MFVLAKSHDEHGLSQFRKVNLFYLTSVSGQVREKLVQYDHFIVYLNSNYYY